MTGDQWSVRTSRNMGGAECLSSSVVPCPPTPPLSVLPSPTPLLLVCVICPLVISMGHGIPCSLVIVTPTPALVTSIPVLVSLPALFSCHSHPRSVVTPAPVLLSPQPLFSCHPSHCSLVTPAPVILSRQPLFSCRPSPALVSRPQLTFSCHPSHCFLVTSATVLLSPQPLFSCHPSHCSLVTPTLLSCHPTPVL